MTDPENPLKNPAPYDDDDAAEDPLLELARLMSEGTFAPPPPAAEDKPPTLDDEFYQYTAGEPPAAASPAAAQPAAAAPHPLHPLAPRPAPAEPAEVPTVEETIPPATDTRPPAAAHPLRPAAPPPEVAEEPAPPPPVDPAAPPPWVKQLPQELAPDWEAEESPDAPSLRAFPGQLTPDPADARNYTDPDGEFDPFDLELPSYLDDYVDDFESARTDTAAAASNAGDDPLHGYPRSDGRIKQGQASEHRPSLQEALGRAVQEEQTLPHPVKEIGGLDRDAEGLVAPPFGPSDGAAEQVPGDGLVEERPRSGGGRGLAVVLVVLTLLAGGGVVALQMGSSTGPIDPILIAADTGETKDFTVATTNLDTGESGPNQAIYDRVTGNEPSNNGELVSNEVEPNRDSPRVVLPNPIDTSTENGLPNTVALPRRVKTVLVRPDGTEIEQPASTAPSNERSTPEAGLNSNETAGQSADNSSVPAETVQPQTEVAEPPQPENQPLDLSSGTSLSDPGQPPTPRPAASTRADPQPAAPAPSAVPRGWVVQLASQPNPALAEASRRELIGRFSGQLTSSNTFVQRADLGTRGVYHRVRYGPFGSKNEAANACNRLKSSGADCFIAQNGG